MESPSGFLKDKIQRAKNVIDGRAIAAVSGGVDSSVAAHIVHEAIGDRLVPLMIDTGFLRKGELEDSVKRLKALGLDVQTIDASERFFDNLKGISDSEEKRSAFGEPYGEVLAEFAQEEGAEWLVQGTIAPDWIESGKGRETIKTHHNVGGLRTDLQLFEPLRDLYKDEVRALADLIGYEYPEQPCPGPGLSVRVLGEVDRERVGVARRAGTIFEEELKRAEIEPWQFFAVVLGRSTGVKGDLRSYGHTVALRAVKSRDGMSADIVELPYSILRRITARICAMDEVNRVVYDVTTKPPATIEWE